MGLAITLVVSIVLGAATGVFISMKKLFETIPDDQLFNDEVGSAQSAIITNITQEIVSFTEVELQ